VPCGQLNKKGIAWVVSTGNKSKEISGPLMGGGPKVGGGSYLGDLSLSQWRKNPKDTIKKNPAAKTKHSRGKKCRRVGGRGRMEVTTSPSVLGKPSKRENRVRLRERCER